MATTTTNFGWDIPQSTDLVKDGATAIAALGQDIDTALVDLKGGTTGQVLAKASGTDLDFSWVAQDDSNAIQNAIVDAKGDLISATAADTPARLAVGTNGQVLTADSAQATGLKWAAAPGGLTLITTQTLSGVTSQSINNCFSATYDNYIITLNAYSSTADNPTFKLRASGTDSTTGYYGALYVNNFSNGASGNDYQNNEGTWRMRALGTLSNSSTIPNGGFMTIYNPFKAAVTSYNAPFLYAITAGSVGFNGGMHNVNTSYDGFTITNGYAMTGTLRVYGLAN